MGPIIGELLPYALGIAISPIPIIAVVLMLLSPHAKTTGTAFVLGWIVGVVLSVTLFTLVAGVLPTGEGSSSSTTAGIIRIVLGVWLLGLAVKQWRSRPHGDEQAHLPAWIASIDSMKAGKSLSIGFLLAALNPKNLVFSIASGVSLGTANLSGSATAAVIIIFTLVASATVILPVAAYLVATKRMQAPLESLHTWLLHNNNTIMAVLFLILGFVVIGKGISSF